MKTVPIIQARMGSSRLPGKMMLSLGGTETITRVVERVLKANKVDETVVATTTGNADSLLAARAREAGASVYRGSKHNVLQRMFNAATEFDADLVVRIAGDCPAVSPTIVDHAIETIQNTDVDYVSNKLKRTFPLGLDVEVFTIHSFEKVEERTTKPKEREHVTVYYREHPELFQLGNFTSDELFEEQRYQNRTDIELVFDEAADYMLLDRIFSDLPPEKQDIRSIIDYMDHQKEELADIQPDVVRKGKDDVDTRID